MTDPTPATACGWCGRIGTHTAKERPMPKSHPDYDAVHDASDADLAAMVSHALTWSTDD